MRTDPVLGFTFEKDFLVSFSQKLVSPPLKSSFRYLHFFLNENENDKYLNDNERERESKYFLIDF
jgi:hypothetical protein